MIARSNSHDGTIGRLDGWTPSRGQRDLAAYNVGRHTTLDGVTYKVADTRQEREAAFRLVYDSYRKSELIPGNASEMRVTPYHMSPTTDVYVAIHEGKVVYTVTLISDDREGFPLEAIYQAEVDEMRHAGIFMAEVSCLAGEDGYFEQKQGFQVFTNLIGLMLQSARHNDIDRLLLAVHPRHAKFYERFFGCERMSQTRSYAAVQGNPAVLCNHDFKRLDEHRYRLYDDIYRLPYARWELCRQPISAEDCAYFSPAITSYKREMIAVGA